MPNKFFISIPTPNRSASKLWNNFISGGDESLMYMPIKDKTFVQVNNFPILKTLFRAVPLPNWLHYYLWLYPKLWEFDHI